MTLQRELEIRVAAWGAIAFGALLASQSVFRPVRDALVLDGNPDGIPWLFLATFLAMLVVSPVWSAGIARYRARALVPVAFHVFAACAVVFAALVASDRDPVVVGRVFYVWAAVFNLFVVSVFWSLLADLVGAEPARRLFGPIAAGGTVGAIAGPALARLLVEQIGVAGVLCTSAVLLEFAVIAVWQLRRAGDALAPVHAEAPRPGGAFAGIAQVMRSPYLRTLCGYVLCTATAATFLYFEQAQLARAELPDREARAAYFATIDLWTSLAAFVLQAIAARWLLRRLGPGLVLAILPIAQLAGIGLVVLAPSLAAIVFAQVTARSITHGLVRPGRELLFTVIDRDAKYRAKNAIDTVGYRFGDVASAWLWSGLHAAGGSTPILAVTAPLAAGWVVLALVLGVKFRNHPKEAT